MGKNEFLPFGVASGANVLTPTAYGQLAARNTGFTTGVAKSQELNTVWRQSSVIASVVAQFIANRSGDDVLDDGNLAVLQDSLEKALKEKILEVGVVRTVNTQEPDKDGNVKLGTAADADIGTDAGNVLEVGAFGLMPSMPLEQKGDFNNYKTFGFYRLHGAQNPPPGSEPGGNWHLQVTSSSNGAFVIQTAYGIGQDSTPPPTPGRDINRIFVRTYYAGGGGMWSTWVEFYSENHKPTADDINAVKKTGDTMTGSLDVDGKISLTDGLEIGNQKAPSPAYIDFHTDGTETDYNARIISPQGTTDLNLIAADNANNGSGIVRLLGIKGDALSFALQGTARDALAWRKWGSDERPTVLELDVDGGTWLINVDHTPDNKVALGINGVLNCEGVNVGGARMAADGNIWGTRWDSNGGWLWDASKQE